MQSLVLGWALDADLNPAYWLTENARPGSQSADQLVVVPAEKMARHTIIVAQSGSGKSFFLGRLIEEIALKTRARLLVLDPNADFRRIGDVVSETLWREAKYDTSLGYGRLPHEASCDDFAERWKSIESQILSGPHSTPQNSRRLRVSWSTFPIAFIVEDLDAIAGSQVYHCHEFVKSIAFMYSIKQSSGAYNPSEVAYPFDKARKLLQRARHEGVQAVLDEEFPKSKKPKRGGTVERNWRKNDYFDARERAVSAIEFVSPEIERFYFGRVKEYVAKGIVSNSVNEFFDGERNRRIQVLDLPSFRDPRTQQVVLSSFVSHMLDGAREDWDKAFIKDPEKDERVPLFIVLDEAHNIVPNEVQGPSAEALREQFRTIAAEGRKYGVFLILCTQRPDKIDARIVSECENKAIMRMGADAILAKTRDVLGLESIPSDALRKCLQFRTGRFMLSGVWTSGDHQLGFAAMRRTIEGGRNLRHQHWAMPDPSQSAAVFP